jgi:hypothetical protein
MAACTENQVRSVHFGMSNFRHLESQLHVSEIEFHNPGIDRLVT